MDSWGTLSQFHLTYGISVWGGISDSKLNNIFTIQKHCIRVLFGDRNLYLDKFWTCARVRPKEEGIHGSEFYSREHTKPLFNEHKLLVVKHSYHFFCAVQISKIRKFRLPMNLYETYNLSNRETSLTLLTPNRSYQFY